MDKLLALTHFVETLRCGSYSAAARKLGVATSSVTRQVAALEAELGAALLNRSTRHISATEAGQAYFEHALSILDAMERADNSITDRGGQARGRLRVSVPVEFGRQVIAPYLGRLLAQHPALEISLNLTDTRVDLLKERIDLSVRLGSSLSSEDIVCKPVGEFQRWIVASPAYLAGKATPTEPHDLLNHPCLRFDYGHTEQAWFFGHEDTRLPVGVQGRLHSNNADVLRQAAVSGEGIALLADWLVAEDVRHGRLVRLLADYVVSPAKADGSINVLYLPNHRGSTRINVFVAFLREVLAGG